MKFTVPAELKSLNWSPIRAARAACSARARKATMEVLERTPPPTYEPIHIQITRIGPRELDSDNLIGACKPVRDAVAAWLGIDDGSNRIEWTYGQQVEKVEDPTPRAKHKYRTWVELGISPTPLQSSQPSPAPPRYERERKAPPVPEAQGSGSLVREIQVGTRGLRLGLMRHQDQEYVRVCTHFTQQGQVFRTQGVRVDIEELDLLIEALRIVLRT